MLSKQSSQCQLPFLPPVSFPLGQHGDIPLLVRGTTPLLLRSTLPDLTHWAWQSLTAPAATPQLGLHLTCSQWHSCLFACTMERVPTWHILSPLQRKLLGTKYCWAQPWLCCESGDRTAWITMKEHVENSSVCFQLQQHSSFSSVIACSHCTAKVPPFRKYTCVFFILAYLVVPILFLIRWEFIPVPVEE